MKHLESYLTKITITPFKRIYFCKYTVHKSDDTSRFDSGKYRPLEQVSYIAALLSEYRDRRIVANSYGAYLTLQALVDLNVTPKDIILLSPVMGKAKAKDRAYMSRPPLTKRLNLALEEGRLVRPEKFALYIGDQDPIYDSELTEDFRNYFGDECVIVLEGEGHMLDRELTANIIRKKI